MGGSANKDASKKIIVSKNKTAIVDDLEIDEVAISDENLEQEDQKIEKAKKSAKKQSKLLRTPEEKKKIRRKKLAVCSALLLIIIAVLLIVPITRWPILNAVGLRSSLSVQIVDESSGKPVSRAMVRVDGDDFSTSDTNGRISFADVRLGAQRVEVEKIGYGKKTLKVTNGVRTTNVKLLMTVIGIKLDVDVKDWLSGKAISGAEVSFKDANAVSDKTGRASLVVPPQEERTIRLDITAPGYLNKAVKTDVSVESRELSLVSAQKDYFVSKRDGVFDIFSSNLDGTNQQKIIQATGKEDERFFQFEIDRTNSYGILIATRDGKTVNSRVVAGVYSVDLKKATLKKLDEGTDIQLLGWHDSSVSYQISSADLAFDDPGLSKIINYAPLSGQKKDIAQTNFFALSSAANNKVFYVKNDPYRDGIDTTLTSFDVSSGKTKTYLQGQQLLYSSRPSYDALKVTDANGSKYDIQIENGRVAPSDKSPNSIIFARSPSAQYVAWADNRDGQGALLQKNLQTNEQKIVLKISGLTNPIRFVSDDLVIARVVTSQETADYVISLSTGRSGKIADVTNMRTGLIDSL